ncbi:hypothetical protein V8C35DRAFT_22242 [Trichoderma chlorosporum]
MLSDPGWGRVTGQSRLASIRDGDVLVEPGETTWRLEAGVAGRGTRAMREKYNSGTLEKRQTTGRTRGATMSWRMYSHSSDPAIRRCLKPWTQMTRISSHEPHDTSLGVRILVRVEYRGLATDARWTNVRGRGGLFGEGKEAGRQVCFFFSPSMLFFFRLQAKSRGPRDGWLKPWRSERQERDKRRTQQKGGDEELEDANRQVAALWRGKVDSS